MKKNLEITQAEWAAYADSYTHCECGVGLLYDGGYLGPYCSEGVRCSLNPFQTPSDLPLDETPVQEQSEDEVNRPRHYTWVPGLEPIDLIEWLPYNLGAAAKYIVRCGHKKNAVQDLQKSIWYIQREIQRLEKMEKNGRATD